MKTPQQRARIDLARDGYVVEALEVTQFNGFKRDGFGCFDLVALGRGRALLIQVTSHAHKAARMAKVQAFLDGANGKDDRPIAPNLPSNWGNWGQFDGIFFEVWTYGRPGGKKALLSTKHTRRRWRLFPHLKPIALDAD